MIQLTSVTKHFGGRTLFRDADLTIGDGQRIGVVGANGTGKTTLFRILAGLEPIDGGKVLRSKNLTIGYLPQEGLSAAGRKLREECRTVFSSLLGMEAEMRALETQLSEPGDGADPSALHSRYAQLQHEFAVHDGYSMDARAGTVLAGLGFSAEDQERPCEDFSGGWQMRIGLAKLLLSAPELLLLDEPTNHLDLEARNWLEDYLATYTGSVLVVSHDRYFLDAVTSTTVELANGALTVYNGNYTSYLRQSEERRATVLAALHAQQQRREQLEIFIRRFRYQATKAAQVQSRIKELERLPKIEIPPNEETVHFKFPQPSPSGRRIIELRDIHKAFGPTIVFRGIHLVIERGDHVALVGYNGAGKSTLLKLLAGIEPADRGERNLGHNVSIDYFAQDQYRALDPEQRLLDDIASIAPVAVSPKLRNLLGAFLFREDDVFKRIGVLSGGERNRYALARMLLRPSNFLLLDEPTNHLDMRAKEVLLRALKEFSGTTIFVSHDRYFIDELATKVIEVGHGQIEVYPGNYEDFMYRKAHMAAGESSPDAVIAVNGASSPAKLPDSAQRKRMNPQKRRKLESEIERLEAEIRKVEAELGAIEQAMAGAELYRDGEQTQLTLSRYTEQKTLRATLVRDWERKTEALAHETGPVV
jgi:ATP-binding cassette subfamily F protein 3